MDGCCQDIRLQKKPFMELLPKLGKGSPVSSVSLERSSNHEMLQLSKVSPYSVNSQEGKILKCLLHKQDLHLVGILPKLVSSHLLIQTLIGFLERPS